MQLPSYRWRFAHLAALWGYGVSQPVFSMLKGNPEFLVVRGSTHTDVVTFALLVAFVPPMAAVGLEALVSAVSRILGGVLHIVAIWCFGYVALLQIVRLLDNQRGAALLIPLLPAALAAVLYVRSRGFQRFLSVSSILPVVGLVFFVATIPLAVNDRAGVDVEVTKPKPIVLVVLDEFALSSLLKPDGSIDAVRYPNFAHLANGATWYPRATTVADYTTDAVPAILTGKRPESGDLPTLTDHPENLFTLLGERYRIEAQEQVTRLCPTRYCPRVRPSLSPVTRQKGLTYDALVGYLHGTLPRSLTGTLPPLGERWGGFGENAEIPVRDQVVGALNFAAWLHVAERAQDDKRGEFARFLRSIRAREPRATMHFLHLMLPHSPWQFLPSGREYNGVVTEEAMYEDWSGWRPWRWLTNQALQADLLQVRYTDRLIGLLLKKLRAIGLYDRSLIIVTADHGMSFRSDAPPRVVTRANVADIAAVPLFVKFPGQLRPRIDRRNALTVDILPTVADVIGVRLPWPVDGRSLLRRDVARDVSVMRHKGGGSVSADADAISREVLATARRNRALFGIGADPLYRVGPYKSLFGRAVESISVSGLDDTNVRLDDEALYTGIRMSSLFVPARVAGRIIGLENPEGTPLAIAVNGRIAAMTKAFRLRGDSRFVALVPETAFVDGRNLVEIYAVASTGRGMRLRLLGGTGGESDFRPHDSASGHKAATRHAPASSRASPGVPGSARGPSVARMPASS